MYSITILLDFSYHHIHIYIHQRSFLMNEFIIMHENFVILRKALKIEFSGVKSSPKQ